MRFLFFLFACVQVFSAVAHARESGLQVLDYGVSNATLEEVFIKLARQAGAQAAAD